MTVVNHTLKRPGGVPWAHLAVELRLLASANGDGGGFVASTQSEILATQTFRTDASGLLSMDLVPNSQIVPANTAYQVMLPGANGGVVPETFVVSDAPGPLWLGDLLASPPSGLPGTALSDHLGDAVDAHDASAVSFAPSGSIAASTVQAALAELDAEKETPVGAQAKVDAETAARIADVNAEAAARAAADAAHDGSTGAHIGTLVPAAQDVRRLVMTGVAATDTAAINNAIAAANAGRPTEIRIVSTPDYAALGALDGLITLDKAGVWLTSDAPATPAGGARLRWDGAAGGTMVAVTAARSGVRNIALDANDLAATCIRYDNGERMGYEDLTCENFTGAGVVIGNGVANNNGFRGKGALYMRGNAGSTPLTVNCQATENVHLDTVNIGLAGGEVAALTRCVDLVNGHVSIDDLIVDDDFILDYGIRVQAASFDIENLVSECAQTLVCTAAGRSRGSRIGTGDLRSCNVQAGQFAMDLTSTGDNSYPFEVGGVRVNRKAGAANAPNVRVNGATCAALGTYFTSSDAGAAGTFVPTSTGTLLWVTDAGAVLPTIALLNDKRLQGYLADGVTLADLVRITTSNNAIIGGLAGLVGLLLRTASGNIDFEDSTAVRGRFSGTIADTETALFLRRNVGGALSLQRVSMGAADSAGAGFKTLRVPN